MRDFEFQLKLPDGTVVAAAATSTSWAVAFTEACLEAEQHYELGPWAGISCVSYSSTPSDEVVGTCPVEMDEAGAIRMGSWRSFRAAA